MAHILMLEVKFRTAIKSKVTLCFIKLILLIFHAVSGLRSKFHCVSNLKQRLVLWTSKV